MFHWAASAAPFAMSARVFLFKNPWVKPPSLEGWRVSALFSGLEGAELSSWYFGWILC